MFKNIGKAKNIFLAFLFFLYITTVNGQSFYLTGHVFDGKSPLTGASILISNNHVGNSDASGYFEASAKLGDTLKISFPFYEVATLILTDSLQKRINLTPKVFQLDDVQVNFNKRKIIDSLLNTSFYKLKSDPINAKVFLRQSVAQNNEKVRLLNEGLLSVYSPNLNELIETGSSKKIKLNVDCSCNLINTKISPRITYGSNPQIKLRLGFLPKHFYALVKQNIIEESIKSDSGITVIQVKGNLALKDKVEVSYVWILDQETNTLKQSQYFEHYTNKKYFIFYNYTYRDNQLYSALISAKQVIGRNSYATNDEIFLFMQNGIKPSKWNFDSNKCGLEKYVEQAGSCDELKDFKTKNQISTRGLF